MENNKVHHGQTILAEHLATVTIDNARGSSRYFTITDSGREVHLPLEIEYEPQKGTVLIDNIPLTSNQRILLLQFLTQPDSGYVSGHQCIYNIR